MLAFRIAACGLLLSPQLSFAQQVGDGATEAGEDEVAELARAAQNPIASMISLPFQNNTNLNFGPLEETQNVLNIQPVIPFELNDDWNLITRTIIPVISQPAFAPGQSTTTGLGDTVLSGFFSPKAPTSGGWIWGVGPAVILPTTSVCSKYDICGDQRIG